MGCFVVQNGLDVRYTLTTNPWCKNVVVVVFSLKPTELDYEQLRQMKRDKVTTVQPGL